MAACDQAIMPTLRNPISIIMKSLSHTSRRTFLRQALAVSVLGGINILPAHARRVSPNSKVRLAVVGCGNRGAAVGNWFLGKDICEIVTVCDVHIDGDHTQGFLGKLPASTTRYVDFREMFDKEEKNIDAVIVNTPDHSHFPVTMQAMALGKHVYVEKPMAHTFLQSELMMQAAEKHGVVTQVGNQGHSEANRTQFKAWTEGGIIKDVHRIDAYMTARRRWHGWDVSSMPEAQEMPEGLDWETWCATAPMTGFHPHLHPANWRSWFDYGCGAFGDWGPHILDTCHRFLDLGLPSEVIAEHRDGPNDYIFPQASTIRFKFPARGAHPACDVWWFDGQGNNAPLPPEIEEGTNMGNAGKIIHSKELVFRGASHGSTLRIVPREKFREMHDQLPEYEQRTPDHASNFLMACRGEAEANSPFSVGGPLNQMFNLGILAQRYGGTIKFDRDTKEITSHANGREMLNGNPPRPGWEQYYRL